MTKNNSMPAFGVVDGKFYLLVDVKYCFPWSNHQYVFIPEGYQTNFASIPWFVRWIISPIDRRIVIAAMVHDWLVGEFSKGPQKVLSALFMPERVSWKDAAWYMREIMRYEDAPVWKRVAVYSGVRLWGFVSGR